MTYFLAQTKQRILFEKLKLQSKDRKLIQTDPAEAIQSLTSQLEKPERS